MLSAKGSTQILSAVAVWFWHGLVVSVVLLVALLLLAVLLLGVGMMAYQAVS